MSDPIRLSVSTDAGPNSNPMQTPAPCQSEAAHAPHAFVPGVLFNVCSACGQRAAHKNHSAPAPVAQGDEAAVEALTAIQMGVQATDKVYTVRARAILAAIRQGEVPGIYADSVHVSMIRDRDNEIANYREMNRKAQDQNAAQAKRIAELERQIVGEMNQADAHRKNRSIQRPVSPGGRVARSGEDACWMRTFDRRETMMDAAGFYRFDWNGWDVAVWRHHRGVSVQADDNNGNHVMALLDKDSHRDWLAHPDLRQAVRDRIACFYPQGFP